MFSTTDLTAIEENVIPTLIVASAQLIAAQLSPVLMSYSATGDILSFDVNPSRWGTELPKAFADGVRSFIIVDALRSVLAMIVPDLAPKYEADAKNLLAALAAIAFTKQPPAQSTAEYSEVSGQMCNDDGSNFQPVQV